VSVIQHIFSHHLQTALVWRRTSSSRTSNLRHLILFIASFLYKKLTACGVSGCLLRWVGQLSYDRNRTHQIRVGPILSTVEILLNHYKRQEITPGLYHCIRLYHSSVLLLWTMLTQLGLVGTITQKQKLSNPTYRATTDATCSKFQWTIFEQFRIWNGLPEDVVSAPTLSSFRRRLKPFLFQHSHTDIVI